MFMLRMAAFKGQVSLKLENNMILKTSCSWGLILVLTSCNSFRVASTTATNNVYCDNFLIYEMCAEDLNNDGIVEHVYFLDTLEVFLFRKGAKQSIPDHLSMHRCIRVMDEALVATTNRVFEVTDETSYLEKQDIRGAMMIRYFAHLPEITACNLRADQAEQS